MTSPEVTYFYVRIPDHMSVERSLSHADETVNIAGAFFSQVEGKYLMQADGTYEVRAVATCNTDTVRSMLTDHEGLIIEREEVHPGGIANLIVAVER